MTKMNTTKQALGQIKYTAIAYIISLFAFLMLSLSTRAGSNYYWVGGSGNWNDYSIHWATSSGGQFFRIQVPGPQDTVIFDSLSFSAQDTVWCDSSLITCHTMKWVNVLYHPMFATKYVSNGNIFKIYGSLIADTSLTWNYNGKVLFRSVNPGNTISTGGQYLPYISFEGKNGEWRLTDTLRAGNIYSHKGTFRSNGQPIFCRDFRCLNSDTTSIRLDTSLILVSDSFYVDQNVLQFDADSITLFMSGYYFFGGNNIYGRVYFPQNSRLVDNNTFHKATFGTYATLNSSNTFDTLVMSRPGVTLSLANGTTQLINDSMDVNGDCSALSVIECYNYGGNATVSKSSGTLNLTCLLLEDVSATGGATFNAITSVALGNCSGWNMINSPAPRTLFWVGGSGRWTDANHWSLSSGGPGGNCVPDPFDNVYFDASSFTNPGDTVLLDALTAYADNFDWSGAFGNPMLLSDTANMKLKIYSSITLIPQMNYALGASLWFRSGNPGNTITVAGHSLSSMTFWGSGDWTLQDNLNCGSINMVEGTFISNNQNIGTGDVYSMYGATRSILLGTSNVTTGGWEISPGGLSLNASSSTLNVLGSGYYSFISSSQNYNRVNFPNGATMQSQDNFNYVNIDGDAYLLDNNTFDTLVCNSADYTVTLRAGTTQVITGDLSINGSCAGLAGLETDAPGSQAHFFKQGGSVTINYCVMQDVDAGGGANFNAMFCVPVINVTGWNVTPIPPNNFYWINGAGSWSDPNHWSLTSGGPAGNCVPSPVNNVYFDANSFSGNNESVSLNVKNSYCNSMDWTGASGTPSFASNGKVLKIYGSLSFISNMSSSDVPFLFRSTSAGNTISCASQRAGYMKFEGVGGTWDLLDSASADSIHVNCGTVRTNSNSISAGSICSISQQQRSFSADSSSIFTSQWTMSTSSQLSLDADSTTIHLTGETFVGGGRRYHDLLVSGDGEVIDADTFRLVKFNRFGTLSQSNVIDSLVLDNAGFQLTLGSGSTQTINRCMQAFSSSMLPIAIESSQSGVQGVIYKAADTVCIEYVNLTDIKAYGGALFCAGKPQYDISNNSGWLWVGCGSMVVWPGDANWDLTADNMDILQIGIGYGNTGPQRPNATNNWNAEVMADWNIQFADSVNMKHADCDGNGMVDMADTIAISQNYGQFHPARYIHQEEVSASAAALYFGTPIGVVAPGNTIILPVKLGTAILMANNVYGLATSVNYDQTKIVTNSVSVNFNNSWLVQPGNMVTIVRDFSGIGQNDVALCQIDHSDTSGFGTIFNFVFTIDPNATGVLNFSFSGIKVINQDGDSIDVSSGSTSIVLTGITGQSSVGQVEIYPNPSNGVFQIANDQFRNNSCEVTVYDMLGNQVTKRSFGQDEELKMDLTDRPKGAYILKLVAEDKIFTQRLLIR